MSIDHNLDDISDWDLDEGEWTFSSVIQYFGIMGFVEKLLLLIQEVALHYHSKMKISQ